MLGDGMKPYRSCLFQRAEAREAGPAIRTGGSIGRRTEERSEDGIDGELNKAGWSEVQAMLNRPDDGVSASVP